MRNGTFTIYNGIEFELSENMDGEFKLISRGEKYESLGFVPFSCDGVYFKHIDFYELKTAYYISTRALYKGYEFQVIEEKEFEIQILHGYDVGLKLGMEFRDRGVYVMWVNKSDVDKIWEEKKSVYDFKLPE